jgi:lipid-binding SYLF domain-containing protein
MIPNNIKHQQTVDNTTTKKKTKDDIYAFITAQKGAMAGIGIQGNKITKLAK